MSPQIPETSALAPAAPDSRWPVSIKDHRIEFAIMQPPLSSGITFTRPSPWVWHVSLDGRRVGTVNGDSSCGFIARDIDYRSIGHAYLSAEAAMQACVPVRDNHR